MTAPNDHTPIDELVTLLGSSDASSRQRAFDVLSRSNDPSVVDELVALLGNRLGFVVMRALELLCARADPTSRDALEHLAASDDRFDLVWLARYGLSAIKGEVPPSVPDSATRRRDYGPALVYESITWMERTNEAAPEQHGDEWAVTLLPSFHPEILVTVGPDDARVWFSHSSIWGDINTLGTIPASANCRTLTVVPATLDEMRKLLIEGFAGTASGVHLDGLGVGGYRFFDGARVELPHVRAQGALLDFVALVRSVGIATSSHFSVYSAFRDLGGYIGVGLETSEILSPLHAISLGGRLDPSDWAAFEARHADDAVDIVDVTGLGFLPPALRDEFARWVDRTGAVVVADPRNPYTTIHALEARTFEEWDDAGHEVADRPTLDVVGYWTAEADDGLPHPAQFVNSEASRTEFAAVADLLDAGVPYVYMMGRSPCRLCGKSNGSAELTDGRLAWPEGLAHYVRDHDVVLPAGIVARLASIGVAADGWLLQLAAEACDRSLDLWRQLTADRADRRSPDGV